MSDSKDYITLAEKFASTKYSKLDLWHWQKVRDGVVHGYLARANEEQGNIAKLHARIKELETTLNKAQDPYAE